MNSSDIQKNFLGIMHSPEQMKLLFNHLPDIFFFLKNRAGKFVMANELFVQQCGATTESDIIGKDDFDFFPKDRAEVYAADDRFVMETGESVIDRVELAPDRGNAINWFVTTKVPVFSKDGAIIGLAGTARDVNRAQSTLRPYTEMKRVLEFVQENYARTIEVKELAALAHLSVSQFERRFRSVFQLTPLQHVLNVRMRAASLRLIDSHDTIACIALECGFYDHAHFTRTFRRIMGITPRDYRKK